MKASEVRRSFLDFFKQQDHKVVPSSPVVPTDDPTLLFINAGMNQFKDVFLGTGSRPYKRAADSQKCIRVSGKHNDLEEVGFDSYHHTFFEMLGNWSFGDYYKKEAISWAWDLITRVWGLPKERIWATVFREDDEAEKLWKQVTDIGHSRILKFDEKDNFWEMGDTGPCGPCSEIHIDLGEGFCDKGHVPGHRCGVNQGCARVIELWNLVFIQFNRDEKGKLELLPSKHVDTGMGLERAAAVLQGHGSNYRTDLFVPILDAVSGLTSKPWEDPAHTAPVRVIADHIRALTMAITDGAVPSNEGRGYVLRRILRRAARYGRNLGMHEPFIYKLVDTVSEIMGEAYPEVPQRAEHTILVIRSEEERFNEVLDRGIEIFDKVLKETRKRGQKVISGKDVFLLYDTYGFPIDLTQLMAREQGMTLDEAGFQEALENQRSRARKAGKFASADESDWNTISKGDDSRFVGYENLEAEAQIRKFRQKGDKVTLLLDRTPFYGESGGQVGDRGEIEGDGFRVEVEDTQKQGDRILHIGTLKDGKIKGTAVNAKVQRDLRLSTARNHTATHLLHKALKAVLGKHVNQSGSLVTPERFRFDFTHFEAPKPKQLEEVEALVNLHVRADLPVDKFIASLDEAKRMGATALFGEKYGEEVRVIKIDDVSMELCGGTHLDRTGQIGYFRIVSEESVAAGIRRIEGVTGEAADRLVRQEKLVLRQIESMLRCRPDEVVSRLDALQDEKRQLEKSLKTARKTSSHSELESLLSGALDVEGVRLVSAEVAAESVDELRGLGDRLREGLKSGVGVLGASMGGKVSFLAVVTDDLIQKRNLKAGDIVREVAAEAGGSGGGKPHLALAGGKDPARMNAALKKAPELLRHLLTKEQSDAKERGSKS